MNLETAFSCSNNPRLCVLVAKKYGVVWSDPGGDEHLETNEARV